MPSDTETAIEVLESLKADLDPRSDEYADVSQTLHYLRQRAPEAADGPKTVDGRFTPEGVSVSVYDSNGNVIDETWFTWAEAHDRTGVSQSDFTFEL